MLLLDIAAGLLIGTMTGMGIGGGGLLVIYLTLLRNSPQLAAQSMNLYFFIIASAASLLVHFRRRRIELSNVVPAVLLGMAGAFFGSHAASALPEELIRKYFGIMLIVSGSLTLIKSINFRKREENELDLR